MTRCGRCDNWPRHRRSHLAIWIQISLHASWTHSLRYSVNLSCLCVLTSLFACYSNLRWPSVVLFSQSSAICRLGIHSVWFSSLRSISLALLACCRRFLERPRHSFSLRVGPCSSTSPCGWRSSSSTITLHRLQFLQKTSFVFQDSAALHNIVY